MITGGKEMQMRCVKMILLMVGVLAIAGCGGTKVTRIEVDDSTEMSGQWSSVDSREVSAALESQAMGSPWVEDFRAENAKKPYVIIGTVRNRTAEHIPVKTFIADLERSFINGGRVRVVASPEERDQIRAERAAQQDYASPETMKQWGREKGADFMFMGEINAIFDTEGKDSIKYYQVDCYLVDLEDNTKVWAGYEKIKKLVER